jgi:hypothetical protein
MTSKSPQIRDKNVSSVIFGWIFGSIVLSFGAFLIFGVHHSGPDSSPMWLGLVPTAMAILLFVQASWGTLCLLKYGRSVFDPTPIPSTTDGELRGTIRLAKPIKILKPIQLRLACVAGARVVMWERRRTLDQYSTGVDVSEIPVHFEMPPDARPTSARIKWLLYVNAKMKGIGFRAMFYIPVTSSPGNDLRSWSS